VTVQPVVVQALAIPIATPPATAPASPPDADERAKRYVDAQKHPVVQDLLKRFEADIVAREPGNRQAWEERMRRG